MTQIQLRRDTLENWQTTNPVLAEGEIGIETDTNRIKIGNGTDTYKDLSYSYIPMSNFKGITSQQTPGDFLVRNEDVQKDITWSAFRNEELNKTIYAYYPTNISGYTTGYVYDNVDSSSYPQIEHIIGTTSHSSNIPTQVYISGTSYARYEEGDVEKTYTCPNYTYIPDGNYIGNEPLPGTQKTFDLFDLSDFYYTGSSFPTVLLINSSGNLYVRPLYNVLYGIQDFTSDMEKMDLFIPGSSIFDTQDNPYGYNTEYLMTNIVNNSKILGYRLYGGYFISCYNFYNNVEFEMASLINFFTIDKFTRNLHNINTTLTENGSRYPMIHTDNSYSSSKSRNQGLAIEYYNGNNQAYVLDTLNAKDIIDTSDIVNKLELLKTYDLNDDAYDTTQSQTITWMAYKYTDEESVEHVIFLNKESYDYNINKSFYLGKNYPLLFENISTTDTAYPNIDKVWGYTQLGSRLYALQDGADGITCYKISDTGTRTNISLVRNTSKDISVTYTNVKSIRIQSNSTYNTTNEAIYYPIILLSNYIDGIEFYLTKYSPSDNYAFELLPTETMYITGMNGIYDIKTTGNKLSGLFYYNSRGRIPSITFLGSIDTSGSLGYEEIPTDYKTLYKLTHLYTYYNENKRVKLDNSLTEYTTPETGRLIVGIKASSASDWVKISSANMYHRSFCCSCEGYTDYIEAYMDVQPGVKLLIDASQRPSAMYIYWIPQAVGLSTPK